MSRLLDMLGPSSNGTIHSPRLSLHPWSTGGARAFTDTSSCLYICTPCCSGKKTVVYPLSANVPTLKSAGCFIPGTTNDSLTSLGRASMGNNAVCEAGRAPPFAATTDRSDSPVSVTPVFELIKWRLVPESNIPSRIASSTA